ncbi:DUF3078 domain-containing protein [Mangrovimonas cancribranchiae]|uniref:DUF3078 domain-containing protein n=1 Tax=Mangrovimonas cancribranchiae TaxID=3080055 RepID=A0AAU6P718_9FLAO
MTKKLLTAILFLLTLNIGFAQTLEELKAEQAAKKDSISAIQGRVDDIQKQIDEMPGWRFGAVGIIGGSFSEFNNWYAQSSPNNSSGKIGITFTPYAKLIKEDYFWYNNANVNLSWVKFDDKDDPTDEKDWREATDVFNVTSLFGYNLTKTIAVSTLAEYRTTVLDNFNDPGYLDVGVGATWKPNADLVVVVHPLNYNFVFADNDAVFDSSLGAKIVANYTKTFGGINFISNLSAFQSYKDSDLSNWTWINSASYSLWKGIGVGVEVGLRNNKQEALNYAISQYDTASTNPEPTFDNVDNDIQVYTTFGLSYSF